MDADFNEGWRASKSRLRRLLRLKGSFGEGGERGKEETDDDDDDHHHQHHHQDEGDDDDDDHDDDDDDGGAEVENDEGVEERGSDAEERCEEDCEEDVGAERDVRNAASDDDLEILSVEVRPQREEKGKTPGSGTQRGSDKKAAFTDEQKNWIAKRCKSIWRGHKPNEKSYPGSIQVLLRERELLKQGIAEGMLPRGATIEQLRHVARTWLRSRAPAM